MAQRGLVAYGDQPTTFFDRKFTDRRIFLSVIFLSKPSSLESFDFETNSCQNRGMSIDTIETADAMKKLQDAVDRLTRGVRDREAMRKARQEMNRMREETRQRIGVVDMAVDLVRDARK
ncbi:MAG: hypothetical protein ACREDH_14270 [Methylocella sp.]